MVISPACSLFLESMSTGQQGHDNKFIARDIECMIVRHENTLFADTVTNNTNTNKKAWQLLKARFPSCYFQGCYSHGVHLFVKDVFKTTKTKKRGNTKPMYPDIYLFDYLHDFIEDCNDVVKFFHNHHAPKVQLSELQKTTSVQALVKATPTRWGTIKDMAKTLLQSEQHLHAIVTACNFVRRMAAQKEQRKAVRDMVTDQHFIDNLKKTLAILHPVDGLIVKY
jgi:hypothetical protein